MNYNEGDKLLCQDALSTEKYVSSTYNTSIFEFRDKNIRQVLNHIQKEEQLVKVLSDEARLNSSVNQKYHDFFQDYMAACDEVERIVPQSDERDSLVRFIRTSKRGVIKPYETRSREE